ncbi:hypothetical protein PILCRDRAFT_271340 [Piloderma croceum F 1598]|uniref:Uncharacterized protein n=1 Tax=Piloderma croceum (strain F 1598) TaxID=765440 RepID=A0A0C3G680_PILCF|nr:hypothetical protein PILCRDRAFT_271340 [Piloderma croceum F 1598]
MEGSVKTKVSHSAYVHHPPNVSCFNNNFFFKVSRKLWDQNQDVIEFAQSRGRVVAISVRCRYNEFLHSISLIH